ncbi:hypothetical protein PT974_12559 [Cladobotryum mycophilum]|uniref:Uncharacterized protein n=1 Tax=Cladobotryum mycophilum TaxID=491253 RepID=A0ABR0S8B8_9HYPO
MHLFTLLPFALAVSAERLATFFSRPQFRGAALAVSTPNECFDLVADGGPGLANGFSSVQFGSAKHCDAFGDSVCGVDGFSFNDSLQWERSGALARSVKCYISE